MKNSGMSIFWQYAKKLEIKSRTRSRSRPRIERSLLPRVGVMGFVISPLSLYERNVLPRVWRNTNACNQMVPIVEDKSFSCSFWALVDEGMFGRRTKEHYLWRRLFLNGSPSFVLSICRSFSARFESIMFSFRWECSHWFHALAA